MNTEQPAKAVVIENEVKIAYLISNNKHIQNFIRCSGVPVLYHPRAGEILCCCVNDMAESTHVPTTDVKMHRFTLGPGGDTDR